MQTDAYSIKVEVLSLAVIYVRRGHFFAQRHLIRLAPVGEWWFEDVLVEVFFSSFVDYAFPFSIEFTFPIFVLFFSPPPALVGLLNVQRAFQGFYYQLRMEIGIKKLKKSLQASRGVRVYLCVVQAQEGIEICVEMALRCSITPV